MAAAEAVCCTQQSTHLCLTKLCPSHCSRANTSPSISWMMTTVVLTVGVLVTYLKLRRLAPMRNMLPPACMHHTSVRHIYIISRQSGMQAASCMISRQSGMQAAS